MVSRALGGSNTIKLMKRYRVLYVFLLPSFIAVLLFQYRPFTWIVMAFQDFDFLKLYAGEPSPWVGLKHFVDFVTGSEFMRLMRNTLAINGLSILIGFPMPIIFALLINEVKNRAFKKTIQTITYLPHFLSWVVISGLFYSLLDQSTGLVNKIIESLGGTSVAFLREPDMFWPLIISTAIWKEIGWSSIIYLAALSSIDDTLYEAAKIDGANRLQEVWHISLPGLLPTISVILIMTTGRILTGGGLIPDFEAVFNMGNPMLQETSETIAIHVYYRGVMGARYSYATAVGLFQSVIAFVFVFGSNYLSKTLKGYGVI